MDDRGPLRVMFVITCMPVGGAERLLVELIRGLDRSKFLPELCCLKYPGPLGELLASEVPTFSGLLAHKYDFGVLRRLTKLMRSRRVDAVVTVGTGGDKMFWGRLAGWFCGAPVICSALHSTGLPDHVEFPNRLLSPITDAFIAVAESHGDYLTRHEGCPVRKVRVIPNGVDTRAFHPRWPNPALKKELGLDDDSPVAGIVAALRAEKHHELFLRSAKLIRQAVPGARFLVVGDGPERAKLEARAEELSIADAVGFLGTRNDVTDLLSVMNVLLLTSHMEANPVSIMEAMACELPVVATRVGSVSETVLDGRTGYLTTPGDAGEIARRVIELWGDPEKAARMGRVGREHILAHWSLDGMVKGYQNLIAQIYNSKCGQPPEVVPLDVRGGMPVGE